MADKVNTRYENKTALIYLFIYSNIAAAATVVHKYSPNDNHKQFCRFKLMARRSAIEATEGFEGMRN